MECCNHLFRCNQTGYYIGMVSVMSESQYITSASRYQSRSSMYIRGLIPLNSMELAKAVPIDVTVRHSIKNMGPVFLHLAEFQKEVFSQGFLGFPEPGIVHQ